MDQKFTGLWTGKKSAVNFTSDPSYISNQGLPVHNQQSNHYLAHGSPDTLQSLSSSSEATSS